MLYKWIGCACFLLVCLSITACAAEETYTPPESDQWIAIKPAHKITSIRAFISPLVYRANGILRIEGLTQGANHKIDISASKAGEGAIQAQAIPAPFPPSVGKQARTQVFHINTAEWQDGAYDLQIRITNENDAQAKAVTLSLSFRVVRDAVEAIANQADCAEIKTWLDDHNRQHPIWGKIPTWTNLPHAIANGREGDPYAALRGFVLRAYKNPQLRRMQPYTVYIPKETDLMQPAPLLILLHGSGGDYRNLVADHASGQRFEKHPMLIANAGAFKQQEYRHMALNDVRWVIADMKKKYKIDDDRIYCQGISLGGRGVLECAARMPETFAAVSAQGVYGVMPYLLDPTWPGTVDPVRLQLEVRKDIRSLLPRMQHVPVELFVQYKDTSTPPVNARIIASWLHQNRKGAAPFTVREFDAGHDITMPKYNWASTREWFLKHKRRPAAGQPTPPAPTAMGPIWTIWNKPVLYVYDDTAEDTSVRLQTSAEMSAKVDANFGSPTLPVLAWSKLTDAQKSQNNLILFTAGNSAIDENLSVPWPRGEGALAAAVRTSDLRLAIRPTPWSKHHRILHVAVLGTKPISLNRINWWDSSFHTDWLIGQTNQSGYRAGVKFTAAGFYDKEWAVDLDAYTLDDPRGPMVLRH